MELPKNEATFSVDIVGDTSFKKYDGQFTVRCVLTTGQRHLMELDKSRMLGGSNFPTDALVGLAEVLSTLRARIIEAPEWWKQSGNGNTLTDENILMELYKKVDEAEKAWRQSVKEMASPAKDSTSPNP